jgi:hypothetical protein
MDFQSSRLDGAPVETAGACLVPVCGEIVESAVPDVRASGYPT